MRNLYLYANGRVSALEKDLLTPRTWQMLMSASDQWEAARLLADTWYGRFPGLGQGAFDEVFEAALEATEEELIDLAEDSALVKGILHRRDARNARHIWKAALCGGPAEPVLERPGLVDTALLGDALASEEARSALPPAFARTAAELAGMKDPDPLAVDEVVDRMALEVEMDELPGMGPGFRSFLTAKVDVMNIVSTLRVLAAGLDPALAGDRLLEGGSRTPAEVLQAAVEEGLPELTAEMPGLERLAPHVREALSSRSFLELVRESDRVMLGILDTGSFAVFGPEPLAAFVARREMEVSHLRILVAAKSAGLEKARLQKRLPRG